VSIVGQATWPDVYLNLGDALHIAITVKNDDDVFHDVAVIFAVGTYQGTGYFFPVALWWWYWEDWSGAMLVRMQPLETRVFEATLSIIQPYNLGDNDVIGIVCDVATKWAWQNPSIVVYDAAIGLQKLHVAL